jgi:hypothetical protein
MEFRRMLMGGMALVLLAASARAQTFEAKHFAKDGLSFDYLNGWAIIDESNSDAQQLTLRRDDSDATIKLFVHRGKVDSPEKMSQARSKLIDPYIEFTVKQFVEMGAKPERAPASAQISGAPAEGVRIQAILEHEPGGAEIYWLTLGNRLIVVTFFGPDKALKKAKPTWDVVRDSLHIEETKPKGK